MTAGQLAAPFDVRYAARATGLLAEFNRTGVLSSADVHVATALGRLGGESDEQVVRAVALAVRAVRYGSVCVDLGQVRTTAATAASRGRRTPQCPRPRSCAPGQGRRTPSRTGPPAQPAQRPARPARRSRHPVAPARSPRVRRRY